MQAHAAPRVRTEPLRKAMHRMRIPFRRMRQNFEMRNVASGGLHGLRFWREVGGARVGAFFGFVTDPRGREHLGLQTPEAIVFAFVSPVGHPLHDRLVRRKGSFLETMRRLSVYEAVRFELHRDREEALVRHRPMGGRPDEILVLSSCDFFMSSFRAFWSADFIAKVIALKPPKAPQRRRPRKG